MWATRLGGFALAPVATAAVFLVGILAVVAVAAQLLFPCFRTLRYTRYHSLHFLERSIIGLSYHSRQGDAGIICSLARARLSLRIPTTSNPYFCKVEFFDVRYCGPSASGSCAKLEANIRFPRLSQTWCNARIVDLRLTVRNSEDIPDAIARLRENLLRTIVLGDVHELQHFASAADTRLLWSGEGLGVVAEARGYKVMISGRMYNFGRLKGSLMRNWVADEGRFFLEAQDVLWHKPDLEEAAGKTWLTFVNILYYPRTLVSSLSSALQQPASLLDLEIVHGEIQFCKFRDRDHSLAKHSMQFLGERKPEWMTASFIHGFMWDAMCQVLTGTAQAPSKK